MIINNDKSKKLLTLKILFSLLNIHLNPRFYIVSFPEISLFILTPKRVIAVARS